MNQELWMVLGVIIWIVIGYLIAKIYYWISISKQRREAVSKSKSVVLGQVNEKIAPLLPEFKYSYKDLTFIGKGIDYIIFDWLAEWNLNQIVFMEIKSWKSNLNNNEKQIRDIVEKGKIKYEIMKI